MYLIEDTLDDLLRCLYPRLLESEIRVPTSRGDTLELPGVLLEIRLPRARLSRTEKRGKPFSCLGEFLWYLSGSNSLDLIKYYIPRYEKESSDGLTVYGGYGPRLLNHRGNNQIQNILSLLRRKPTSRRAVIQIFDSDDLSAPRLEVPCTTSLQLLRKANTLDMIVTMRSNDAHKGLPHDVFCFTMLQELLARSLNVELGTYRHFVGSMHLYEDDLDDAKAFLEEGVQARVEMPPMPIGDPWPAVNRLLEAEHQVRTGHTLRAEE